MEQDLGHLFITSSSFHLNKIDLKQCLFKAIIPHSLLATNLVVKTQGYLSPYYILLMVSVIIPLTSLITILYNRCWAS